MTPHAPIVIAHRGASGYVPEHTLRAYELAIEQGADYIEPDLVMSQDGVLIARHENEISATTDIASRPEFAARKRTKHIDGAQVSGWFTEDFTLAELKQLRAKERIPQLRPHNTRFDGVFEVPTLEEILNLLARANAQRPKHQCIGIYPETKHPSYFAACGLAFEEPLVRLLDQFGYRDAASPAYIQSFEVANLKKLRQLTPVRLVQLVNDSGQPYDFARAGNARTYADMLTPAGLAETAGYADAVGANKNLIVPRTQDGAMGAPSDLLRDAHAAGLRVHAWTFRSENFFLPVALRSSVVPHERGLVGAELLRFMRLGVDAVFADQPDEAVRARTEFALTR